MPFRTIFAALPKDFCIPIAIVQHRHKASNENLPAFFRRTSQQRVVDVEDKQWIKPGFVYLAPANYHLLVERGAFSLSVDDTVGHSRPSIDVLFESAADAYRENLIGVVLTGANADGARGVHADQAPRRLRHRSGSAHGRGSGDATGGGGYRTGGSDLAFGTDRAVPGRALQTLDSRDDGPRMNRSTTESAFFSSTTSRTTFWRWSRSWPISVRLWSVRIRAGRRCATSWRPTSR